METIAILSIIWVAVGLFGGSDDDTVMKTDPRWKTFIEQRHPLVDKRNAALAGYRQFRADCIAALDNGNHQLAETLAQQSFDMASLAHECACSIERLARNLLVTPPDGGFKNVREAASRAIRKLPFTMARGAFDRLLADPNMASEKANRLLDIIAISPDCPLYGTLAAERVLHGPFSAAEHKIATSGEYSYLYASVIGRRFKEGETAVKRSGKLWSRYQSRWGLGTSIAQNCSLCGRKLRNGSCKNHGPTGTAGTTA